MAEQVLTTTPSPLEDLKEKNETIKPTFEEQVLAYSSLYSMALICIIWGSIRSLRFVQRKIARKELLDTSILTKDAKKFPITASLVLFGLYLVFKGTDNGILPYIQTKAGPYLPEPVLLQLDNLQNFLKRNDSSPSLGTNLLNRVSNLHPLAAKAVDKAVDYLPEFNKANVVYFLLLLLCWEGCNCLATILEPLFAFFLKRLPIGNRWPRRNIPYLLALKRGKKELEEGELEKAAKKDTEYLISCEFNTHFLVALFFTSFVGISHLYQRHWITNNLLGIAFSIYGIEALHLSSFKAGTILLSGLFIYDVFWVFGTDVMTTVAKGIDAPILLMFPQDILRKGWLDASKHGMLGLGDIVIPGIFIALLRRFDHYVGSKKGKDAKSRYYFVTTVFAYALGLFITMGVMHFFEAAQPALLYLVPTCVLIPLLLAAIRGEFKALWSYSEEHLVEKEDEEAKKEQPKENKKEKKTQ